MRFIQRPKVRRGRHRLVAAAAAAAAADALQPQSPSAVDQHYQPSSPGDHQLPPSAAQTPQPSSTATEQQPPSAAKTPQPSSAVKEQQPPSAAKTLQLSSAVKQQQRQSAVDQPRPLSEQQQSPSAGEQQSPSAAKQHQSPSTAESSQSQLSSPGDSYQKPSAAVRHQPLSAADQCQPPEQQQRGVLETIDKLRAFNHSLSIFLSSFDALSEHPNRVSTSLAAASHYPNKPSATALAPPISGLETTVLPSPISELENTVLASPVSELETTVLASPVSELDTSCRRWEALRKYITTRLSDVDRLRAEVPAALQRAPDPAQVVLDCISRGRYHLNNFTNNPNVTQRRLTQRRVCILILEFYISGCFPAQHELIRGKIDSNAARVALEWRERIICKGGIASAGAMDALGLVLFVGSFGVPEEFSLEDLYELLLLSKLEKEAHVLRRSPFLLEKMPGVISDMTSKGMHVEAVDIVFLFGLEEKFDPLFMLSCLLHKAKQVSEEEMRDEQLSLVSVKELNEKYLTVLESVAKCLEVHKLDSSGFDFDIKQRIMMLRTKNVEIVQKLKNRNIKRNAVEAGPSYARGTLLKRPRPSATELTVEIPGI